MKLTSQKLEVWWKFHKPKFNSFWPIHLCDRQLDVGNSTQHAKHICNMLSCAKNYILTCL